MSQIQETKKAVSQFTKEELAEFRAWFDEFDAQLWDEQFEQDVKSGKLDDAGQKAVADFKSDRSRSL